MAHKVDPHAGRMIAAAMAKAYGMKHIMDKDGVALITWIGLLMSNGISVDLRALVKMSPEDIRRQFELIKQYEQNTSSGVWTAPEGLTCIADFVPPLTEEESSAALIEAIKQSSSPELSGLSCLPMPASYSSEAVSSSAVHAMNGWAIQTQRIRNPETLYELMHAVVKIEQTEGREIKPTVVVACVRDDAPGLSVSGLPVAGFEHAMAMVKNTVSDLPGLYAIMSIVKGYFMLPDVDTEDLSDDERVMFMLVTPSGRAAMMPCEIVNGVIEHRDFKWIEGTGATQ